MAEPVVNKMIDSVIADVKKNAAAITVSPVYSSDPRAKEGVATPDIQTGITIQIPDHTRGTGYDASEPQEKEDARRTREEVNAIHIALADRAGITMVQDGAAIGAKDSTFMYDSKGGKLTEKDVRKQIGAAAAAIEQMNPVDKAKFYADVEAAYASVQKIEQRRRDDREQERQEDERGAPPEGNNIPISYNKNNTLEVPTVGSGRRPSGLVV